MKHHPTKLNQLEDSQLSSPFHTNFAKKLAPLRSASQLNSSSPSGCSDVNYSDSLKTRSILAFAAISALSLPALFLFPHSAHAYETSVTNEVSIEVQAGCNVSATGTKHTSTMTSTTYNTIGEDSVFTISCNDGNGYTIKAVGYSNDVEGTTDLIGTNQNNKIITGTAKNGPTSNWAFKLSQPTGLTITPSYTDFTTIPSSATDVATRKASTGGGYVDSFHASYAAYIAGNQPSDTYTGKVKYTLFHNNELIYNYTINYNLNEGQGGPASNPEKGTSNTGTVQLSATAPTKADHQFMGWCTQATTNETCGGTTYSAGQTIPLTEIDSVINLWAMWKSTSVQRSYSITYNQGADQCNDNSLSNFSNMPSPNPQTGTTTANSVNLSNSTPKYVGDQGTHSFKHWCSVKPTRYDRCDGQTYSPGDPYPLATTTNNVTLWAIWEYIPSSGGIVDQQCAGQD